MLGRFGSFQEVSALNSFSDLYSADSISVKQINCAREKIVVKKTERLGNSTLSKGNQCKWFSNNKFIKLNCLGYEDLAEILSCWTMKFISNFGVCVVKYYPCEIWEGENLIGNGCYSNSFLDGAEEISIRVILNSYFKPFSITYSELREFIMDLYGIDCKFWLDRILCFDCIIRNEDRHFGNLVLLKKEGRIETGPVFDNGASFMSDLVSYNLNCDFEKLFQSVYAKPFRMKFEDQLYSVDRLVLDDSALLSSIIVSTEDTEQGVFWNRAKLCLEKSLRESWGKAWKRVD